MVGGEIDGYSYAVVPATGLIMVRRPDGSLRTLPNAGSDPAGVDAAVRAFIDSDRRTEDDERS